MSYDIYIRDAQGAIAILPEKHQLKGGTYAVDGDNRAKFNITYNYAKHYYQENTLGEKGIRAIYGMKVADSLPLIANAISNLGDDWTPNYWEPTEGNAKLALMNLLALGTLYPDGVWDGD